MQLVYYTVLTVLLLEMHDIPGFVDHGRWQHSLMC